MLKPVFSLCAVLVLVLLPTRAAAEKVMIYDEKRGIIFVDKDEAEKKNWADEKKAPATESKKVLPGLEMPDPVVKTAPAEPISPPGKEVEAVRPADVKTEPLRTASPGPGKVVSTPTGVLRAASPSDLHPDRAEDPAEMYFSSGIEYFKNKDFGNALKNFRAAAEKDTSPLYLLWEARSARFAGDSALMFGILEKILRERPESDVADDALFERAWYCQSNAEYHLADSLYAVLAEQYPFGQSCSTGEEYLEVARQQQRSMRAEIRSTLMSLGMKGDDPEALCRFFQTKFGLPPTGFADRATVLLIRETIAARAAKNIRGDNSALSELSQSVWLLLPGAVFLAALIAGFLVRIRIKQNRLELEMLRRDLTEIRLET